jgi:hypothetical protein
MKITATVAVAALLLPVAAGWREKSSAPLTPAVAAPDLRQKQKPAPPTVRKNIPMPRDPRLAEIAAQIARLGPYETDAEQWLEVSLALMNLPAETLAEAWKLLQAHGSGHGPLVEALFSRWAEFDPSHAADEASAASDSSLQSQAWLGLLSTWIVRDPTAALARVAKLPEGLMREATTLSALEKLALARPADALAFAAALSDKRVADYSKETTLTMWAERDSDAALAWINANEPEETRHLARKKFYDNLTIERPDLAWKLALDEPEFAIREDGVRFALQQWSLPQPERALEAFAKLPEDLRTRDMATNAGAMLIRVAPVPMRELIGGEPPGEFRDELARNWINQHGNNEPAPAIEMAAGMSNPRDRKFMLEFQAGRWLKSDRPAAEAWLAQTTLLDDASKQKLLKP